MLVAEEQIAGRGRMGRSWVSRAGRVAHVLCAAPPGVLCRGQARLAAAADRGRGRQCGAVGVRRGCRAEVAERRPGRATGSWPASSRSSRRRDAVVVGIGLNVATPADALPVSPSGLPATSLLVEGASVCPRGACWPRSCASWNAGTRRSGTTPTRRGPACWPSTAPCARPSGRTVRVELPGGRRPVRRGGGHRRATAACWWRRLPVPRRWRSRRGMSSTSGCYATCTATSWCETRSSQRLSAAWAASSTTARS